MRGRRIAIFCLAGLALFQGPGANAQANRRFTGEWRLVRQKSSHLDAWRQLTLAIRVSGQGVTIRRLFSSGRFRQEDRASFTTDGSVNRVPMKEGKWLDQVHLGVYVPPGAEKTITARWLDGGSRLRVEAEFPLQTSQGEIRVRSTEDYRLSPDGQLLTLTVKRSTRPKPLKFTFVRAD